MDEPERLEAEVAKIEWEARAIADMERIAASGEDLSTEPDHWTGDTPREPVDVTDMSMSVRKLVAHVPLSCCQLADAGIAAECEHEPYTPEPVSRWRRLVVKAGDTVWSWRRRLALRIHPNVDGWEDEW